MKRLMFSINLAPRHKIFWIIFAPTLLLSLFFCTFFFIYKAHSLNTQLEEKSQHLTDQLATASKYTIVLSDKKLMLQLFENTLAYGDISNITVFNSDKNIFSEIGPTAHITTPVLSKLPYTKKEKDFIINIKPIYHIPPSIDNTFSPPPEMLNHQITYNIVGWIKVETSTSQLNTAKHQLFFLLLFIFVSLNISIALIAWRVSISLTQPIEKLSLSLCKLAKNQYLSAKSIKLPIQYSNIQKDILELAERLEQHKKELDDGIEQSTEDMRRNMDSMEEKSAQLYIANKEAMESNRLKSQFLANISHEVRTPLNAILGYTKILQKNIKDNQNKLYIDTIEQSTNNLLAIIGDILDFSKIEAGKLSLDNSQVNLRELVDDVYQILSANLLTSNQQVDLVTDFSSDVPQIIIGDTIRIRQVLTNLIGNALKFTNKGSVKTKVMLSGQDKKNLILSFQVIDTGIGIPDNKISQLFKPFSQVDTSTTRKFSGTGLGLVITKKLVEQMEGCIDVSSVEDVGSTFYFTLKLKPSNQPQPTFEKLKKSILFLEPSTTYRNYLSHYFREIGVEHSACSSVEQIISKLNKQHTHIDAILINVIPNKQSTNDAQELASYAIQQFNIPCILMIQPPGQINHYPALKKICNEILLKPISHKYLFNALKNIQPPGALPPIDQPLLPAPSESKSEVTTNLSGLNILAVDDTPVNLHLLTHWLTPYGLNISLAYSGRKAIEMAQEEQFDLILMDIQMPEMDGLETTQHLRTLTTYKTTPIVAITAHALGDEQEKILSSGMDAYLTKPVDENILINTIENWCLKRDSVQSATTEQIINAFDLNKALTIVNQNSVIAKEMFDMLADSLEGEKKLLKYHFEHQDTDKLIQVVHRIHGASKYTGTTNLTRHAGFLETHLKELGMEDTEGVLEDFLDSIDALLIIRQRIPWPQE